MAIRELACRALFSQSRRAEASNGASKSATYRLAPWVSVRAWEKSLQVGSCSDPNVMYSSLPSVKNQIKDMGFTLESNLAG